jgi:hypothetical protein
MASTTVCSHCHDEQPRQPELSALAEQLWQRLVARGAVESSKHPRSHIDRRLARPTTLEKRAADNVALVLLDSAADVHNPAFARLLLEEAARMLGKPETRP